MVVAVAFFISSLWLLVTANVTFNEQYRNSIHFSAEKGWNGPPTGFVIEENNFHLLHMLNADTTSTNASEPQVWMHTASKDGLQWTHDENKFIYGPAIGVGAASYLYGSTIKLKRPVDGDQYLSFLTQAKAKETSLTYRGSNNLVSSFHGAMTANKDLVDPGLFYIGKDLYAVAVDRSADQCQLAFLRLQLEPTIQFSIVSKWRTGLVASHAPNLLPGHCSSPQVLLLGDKTFIVLSVRNGDSPWRSMYFSGVMDGILEKLIFKPDAAPPKFFDVGYDGLDYKFTSLNDDGRTMTAIGWNGNYASVDKYPEGQKWRGGYTLPRQVKASGGQLVQSFLPDLEKVLGVGSTYSFPVMALENQGSKNCINFDKEVGDSSVKTARAFSFQLEFEGLLAAVGLEITFKNDKDAAHNNLVISYDASSNGGWAVDRSSSHPADNTTPLVNRITESMTGEWESKYLHIVLDKAIIEIIPDNLPAITTSYFSKLPFDTVCFNSVFRDAGVLLRSTARRLGPVLGKNTGEKSPSKSAAAIAGIPLSFLGH